MFAQSDSVSTPSVPSDSLPRHGFPPDPGPPDPGPPDPGPPDPGPPDRGWPRRRVVLRVPSPLRRFTGGASEVATEGSTVRAALAAAGERHPGLTSWIFTERGDLWRFLEVFLGTENVRTLGGIDTRLEDGDVLSLVPATIGGAGEAGPCRPRFGMVFGSPSNTL